MVARAEVEALTTRQQRILHALCRAYILSGKPVSSLALSRSYGLEWSSATIRNELASLERMGLLAQPHQASGRLPTAEGLRVYVDALDRQRGPSGEVAALVDLGLSDVLTPQQGVAATARVVSELSGCVAISFVGEARAGVLRSVQLRPVSSHRAIASLAMEDGSSTVHAIDLDPGVAERLPGIESRLGSLASGRTLDEARRHLTTLLEAQEARVDRALGDALRLGLVLCTLAALDPLWMQVLGHRNLARNRAASTHLAELLGLLEDYSRLADILRQLLGERVGSPLEPGEPAGAGVQVHLDVNLHAPRVSSGREHDGSEGGASLSLVGCRVASASGEGGDRTGAIAVLGTDRMDYEAVIPLVEYAARALAARAQN